MLGYFDDQVVVLIKSRKEVIDFHPLRFFGLRKRICTPKEEGRRLIGGIVQRCLNHQVGIKTETGGVLLQVSLVHSGVELVAGLSTFGFLHFLWLGTQIEGAQRLQGPYIP